MHFRNRVNHSEDRCNDLHLFTIVTQIRGSGVNVFLGFDFFFHPLSDVFKLIVDKSTVARILNIISTEVEETLIKNFTAEVTWDADLVVNSFFKTVNVKRTFNVKEENNSAIVTNQHANHCQNSKAGFLSVVTAHNCVITTQPAVSVCNAVSANGVVGVKHVKHRRKIKCRNKCI